MTAGRTAEERAGPGKPPASTGPKPTSGGPISGPDGAAALRVATHSHSQLRLQRLEDSAAQPETVAGLVVDDTDDAAAHQMGKSAFLGELESALRADLSSTLEGSGFTADNCPWLDYYLKLYRAKDAADVNAAAVRYGVTATSAAELISLIVARVRERVARWRETGEVAETGRVEQEATEAIAPREESVQRLERGPAGVSGAQPRAIQQRLTAGEPLSGPARSSMENAFGAGLDDVRIHTNAEAGTLARGLRAKAFTVGQDVAFAPGQYAPGTLEGDLILAHELVHTLQQRDASTWSPAAESPDLEREANAMAAEVVFGDGHFKGASRSGLQLRRCTDDIEANVEADLRRDIVLLLGKPDDNAIAIVDKIDELKDNAPDALMKIHYFNDIGSVKLIARYPGGRLVLTRVAEALKTGDLVTKVYGDDVLAVVAAYDAQAATPTTDEQEAIDKLNNAINADDPTRLAMYKEDPFPVLLPVRLLESGREEVGGVYYNPHMPKNAVSGHGHAGKTESELRTGTVEGTKFRHLHLGFIQLGPLALSSPEYTRTALFHEFLHYSLGRDRHLGKVTDPDLQQLEQARLSASSLADADEEIEIITRQLEHDFDALTDKDAAGLFAYLAKHMDPAAATQKFIERGVKRMEAFVKGNDKRIARFLKLIGTLDKDQKQALEPLRAAVAVLQPKPASKKKGKGK